MVCGFLGDYLIEENTYHLNDMYAYLHPSMFVGMYVCMYVCTYVRTYVCMYVCRYVRR